MDSTRLAWTQYGSSFSRWVSAYEAAQRRTSEAHAVYQDTQARSHLAFLRAAAHATHTLASLAASGAACAGRGSRAQLAPAAPGAQPLAPAEQPACIPAGERLEILVNAVTCPFLDGHRITGPPVVPAVLVLDWLFRAAAMRHPGLVPFACRDLRVLRGVPVEHFEGDGIRLVVEGRTLQATPSAATLELTLRDGAGKPRYAGLVDMGAASPPLPRASLGRPADGRAWPWSVAGAYSDVLFHRGPFAAITSLDVVSETGASGEVTGLRALGWSDDPDRCVDVAAVDGGLQICALWGYQFLERVPLPTRIGAFHLHRPGPVGSTVLCLLRGRRTGSYRALADLTWTTREGEVVASMQDLEIHLPPHGHRKAGTSRNAGPSP